MRLFKALFAASLLIIALPAASPPARSAPVPDTVFVDPAAGAAPLVSFISAARHTLDGEISLLSSKPVLVALTEAAANHVTTERINLERLLAATHPADAG